jgi:hypothetical protein
MNNTARRISYIFLCAFPFLVLFLAAVRVLRIPGVYHVIGGAVFAAIAVAAWILGARMMGSAGAEGRRLSLAGVLLIAPWAIIALLWVGIGAPFQATNPENHMRYLVLLTNTVLVATGFIALKEVLHDAGERFYSTVGFAAAITAGAAYLVCISNSLAVTVARLSENDGPFIAWLAQFDSTLEFVACVSTYVATAAFAASLGQARWLGRGAARAYVFACMVLVLLLVMRGVTFPELSNDTAPWYVRPGFIAGIPAIPWIMPCLLGVVLLRRAGEPR